MKSFLMTSAAAAVLCLGLAAPAAADCAADIASLKQQSFTGSVDATAGTDAASPVAEPAPSADATAAAPPAEGTNANEVAAAAPALSGAPAAGAVPGTEATAAMNELTEGIATSPAEVDEQQTAQPAETAPSAEQLASADEPLAPVTALTSGGEPVDIMADQLARAEAYQKLGNEGACLNVLEQAKTITQ